VTPRHALGSIVIPAHNEAGVIRRCLDALFNGFEPGELDVVVVCNGCVDDTARLARSSGHPVRVIELGQASKPEALRTGDAAAAAMPRLYLDADVILPGSSARLVLERLQRGAVAARPPILYDSRGSSAPVRSYFRARSRVPAVLGSLWGAGVYGLSAAGRSRFGTFPDLVADDLWVDRHFDSGEVEIVDCAPVVVTVPRSSSDLVRVLRRTYRGKAGTVSASDRVDPAPETLPATMRDLHRLAAAGPRPAVDAATYAWFAVTARLALTLVPVAGAAFAPGRWERDDSSRAG
jgi:glycosyltransferase involved in cell wall biosynthesis